MMTSDYGLDIDAMARVIDDADVLVIRFHVVADRLLVDARVGDGEAPLIRLVPPVSSAEERYRYLERARPGLPLPEHIAVLSWPRYIEVMNDAGLWDRLRRRLVDVGGEDMAARCDEVYGEIRAAERAEVMAAIVGGEGYESLWERTPTA